MSERICTQCPSTATFYPRVYFQRGTQRMGILLFIPRCESHRSPIVESVLTLAEKAVYTARFELEYKKLPDTTRTRVAWVPRAHPDVVKFLAIREREATPTVNGEKRSPLVVEVIPDEEHDRMMREIAGKT